MGSTVEERKRHWTARRKCTVVLEVLQGRVTLAEASRRLNVTAAEIAEWIDTGKAGMENALRAKPRDLCAQYEQRIRELEGRYADVVLELAARKKLSSLLETRAV